VAIVFWICCGLLCYVYAGYPVLAWLLGKVVRRRVATPASDDLPTVTVLIAAHNEVREIAATVRNKLDQDYPATKLDVIVVSDGSVDGTDEAVLAVGDARVRLIRQEPRQGKTSALNLGVPLARGEILVFSDANSLYAPDAVRRLVEPLADPQVGYVTGRMVYRAPDGSLTGEGCSAYMRYENRLRAWETRLGSIVGVDGGVDAMRRAVYTPMRADQLPDFVQPLTVREKGLRVIYEPRALLYEDALAEARDEFRMRVRVALRAWWALRDKAALLDPLRHGVFAWQLWSHKLLRYLGPVFQLGALASNIVLAPRSSFWLGLLTCQAVFYAAALYRHLDRRRALPGLVNLAYYLCVINLASGAALVQFLGGRKKVTWTPRT
jgi:cellulose synthase/poly-beta-1,6-N-acetylglucosamine synthase-like glycosyltransferase